MLRTVLVLVILLSTGYRALSPEGVMPLARESDHSPPFNNKIAINNPGNKYSHNS